jgi:kynurenine formamidase
LRKNWELEKMTNDAPTSNAIKDAASVLQGLSQLLSTGGIRIIDLTQTLSPEFPQIALPPEMGQCWPFRIEEAARYDERGPGWYWNNFSCGENTGTHFDAPNHWISGRDLPNNAVDTIPVQNFVAPACVIDCSAQSARDPDYLMTVQDLFDWEEKHGRIPARSWVLMRTDWSKLWTTAQALAASKTGMDKRNATKEGAMAYQNFDETGQHTPGPTAEVVRFMVEERDVLGFGTEAIGTDAGQGYHLTPPYPCHYLMHGAGRYGLQCLTNLDLLPATGSVLICPPLKIQQGSGSPLRVLAMIVG